MHFGLASFKKPAWAITILLLAIALVALASASTAMAGITYTGAT